MLYDSLLIIALWMITLFALVTLNGGEAVSGPGIQSLLFLELYAFFAYYWRSGGQTLGMLAWQIRLETDSGAPLQYTQVGLRLLGAGLGLACGGLGYWWMLVSPRRRTWADNLSATQLWYAPRSKA
jgi:uncharacterized RDD family membrane protein YckC